MRLRPLLSAAVAAGALAAPCAASGAEYVPGEVIVRYEDGTRGKVKQIGAGESVRAKVAALQRRPDVAYARPNYIAHAAAFVPNDPSLGLQWNLGGPFGINMPDAWELATLRGGEGGKGVTVAVLDTGVAYQRFRRFRRVPDLDSFVRGYDFVAGDRHPNDQNGHGTHVSGTIAQSTNNGIGTAGVAYRAKIMPIRVLNADGAGNTISIARGIRFAAKRGVSVINLSLEFDSAVRASQIPDITSALLYARRRGVLVVAAAGNQSDSVVAFPARAKTVMAVAATTIRGCQANYSNSGTDVDISAPGGGLDAGNSDNAYDVAACRVGAPGRFVYQQTFTNSVRRFGLPDGYEGTSMAAPHVAGVAALVIASKRLGPKPGPAAIEQHLEATARDIGAPGFDPRYGNGLLDAAAALR